MALYQYSKCRLLKMTFHAPVTWFAVVLYGTATENVLKLHFQMLQ